MNVSFSLDPIFFRTAVVFLLLLFAGDSSGQQSFWNASSQAKSVRRPHAAGTYIPTGNKTIYCWAGKNNMQIKVRQYHHGPQTLGGTLSLAGTDVLPNHAPDYHDYPTIIRAADYRMLIFYCDHNYNMYMYRSRKQNSIWDGWDHSLISNAFPGYPDGHPHRRTSTGPAVVRTHAQQCCVRVGGLHDGLPKLLVRRIDPTEAYGRPLPRCGKPPPYYGKTPPYYGQPPP